MIALTPALEAWRAVKTMDDADESLYRHARALCERHGVAKGARLLADELAGEKTPDGARYNPTCVREALRGIL